MAGIKVVSPSVQGIGVADVQLVLRKGFPALCTTMMYIGARPIPLLITAALENIVYQVGGRTCNGLASRIAYLETGLLSFVCFVFNGLGALAATLLAGVTLGQVECCREFFKKQWLHTTIAVSAVGISVLGCASPLVGVIATAGLLSLIFTKVHAVWKNLKLPPEKERVVIVQTLFNQHAQDIQEAFLQLGVEADKIQYMLTNMEKVIETADSLENLFVNVVRSFLLSAVKKK